MSCKALAMYSGAELCYKNIGGETVQDDKLTVREKIAAVMLLIGFLIALGAAGEIECAVVITRFTYVKAIIGLIIMWAAFPVSGE